MTMAPHAPNQDYLATEVLTAPPQKLRLMLIEAAIRYISRARASWTAGYTEEGGELILRAQEIVGELLAALKPDATSELVRNVAALYVFVFRALVEAHVHRNAARLDDALRVLSVEAETWRMVCRQLAESQAAADSMKAQGPGASPPRPAGPQAALPSLAVPLAPSPPVPATRVPPSHIPQAPRPQPLAAYEHEGTSGFSITG
jgi:flagellar protein FliS